MFCYDLFDLIALPIISDADFLSTKNVDSLEEDDSATSIYEKYDSLLHGNRNKSYEYYEFVKFSITCNLFLL